MSDTHIVKDIAVKIKGTGHVGNLVAVTFNNKIIPVLSCDIRIRPGEMNTAKLTVYADDIDIETLQQFTKIEVIKKK